jgi:hypothetical protein
MGGALENISEIISENRKSAWRNQRGAPVAASWRGIFISAAALKRGGVGGGIGGKIGVSVAWRRRRA